MWELYTLQLKGDLYNEHDRISFYKKKEDVAYISW